MPPRVSEAHKAERRAEIMASALHCFAERGYEATTVDDIVRHAGVSKGLIYNYFQSKEQIFVELLEDRTKQFFAELTEQLKDQTSAVGKLKFLIDRYREISLSPERRHWIAVQLEFWLYAGRNPELVPQMETRHGTFVRFISEIIDEGRASGEFRPDVNSNAVATLFWSLRDGIGLHFSAIGNDDEHEQVWTAVQDMLSRYLDARCD